MGSSPLTHDEQRAGPAATSGLRGRAVTVQARGAVLLREVDLDVRPGELCAVIGASGSGKSTLLRVLAGVNAPSAGTVTVDEQPVWSRTEAVGYVPTGDLVHPQLTVREALGYAAALRSHDVAPEERAARVEEVLDELHMTERGDHQVRSLSDGERRRVACGTELVGRPSVLVLDEPTTGLDPGLERRLMLLLRELADRGLAILASTHATGSLTLCDRIAVMGPGGRIVFSGSHEQLLRHFGVATIDEVYTALEQPLTEAPPPLRTVESTDPGGTTLPRRGLPPAAAQVRTLASRYALCLRRDPRSLALMVGQAPLIGLAIGLTVPSRILSDAVLGPFYGVLLAFMLVVGAVWLGLITACREIARERDALYREVAIGVRIGPYLLSKCAVLFPLVAFQVLLLVVAVALLQPPDGPASQYGGVLVVCVVAGWGSAAIGLLVSAVVRNPGQATTALPLVVIPQFLLAGALIPPAQMIDPVRVLSDMTLSRWALSGIGGSLDLGAGISSELRTATGLEGSFFADGVGQPLLMIGMLTVVTLVFAAVLLDRRVAAAVYDEYDLVSPPRA
ncbi:ATP-binding cassette domain-containing protein [Patulibacter defluvii]|uniref:ATP-binding cassette domain-containing protein n=1 Tax=Patulibacter defluvii TaxID=3095358 RepID=UPI002A754D4D|nr:ATP-binding cassette domain-containing protein [Patulibacter sp. DM4]